MAESRPPVGTLSQTLFSSCHQEVLEETLPRLLERCKMPWSRSGREPLTNLWPDVMITTCMSCLIAEPDMNMMLLSKLRIRGRAIKREETPVCMSCQPPRSLPLESILAERGTRN